LIAICVQYGQNTEIGKGWFCISTNDLNYTAIFHGNEYRRRAKICSYNFWWKTSVGRWIQSHLNMDTLGIVIYHILIVYNAVFTMW